MTYMKQTPAVFLRAKKFQACRNVRTFIYRANVYIQKYFQYCQYYVDTKSTKTYLGVLPKVRLFCDRRKFPFDDISKEGMTFVFQARSDTECGSTL
jgi:hypothetical protein